MRCETCGTGFTGPTAYKAHQCPGILTNVPTNWVTDLTAERDQLTAEREQLVAERDAYRDALADISPVDLKRNRPHFRCPARCLNGSPELDPFQPDNHDPDCPWVEARNHQLQENQ